MISKNQMRAKEDWQRRQEKLQNNVKDEEVNQIYKTALESKNLIKKPNQKQKKAMPSTLKKNNIIQDIQNNCQETKKFIEKVEKIQNTNDQSKIPQKILQVVKQMEQQCASNMDLQQPSNPEMTQLLQSLNRIEQTIKFLENDKNQINQPSFQSQNQKQQEIEQISLEKPDEDKFLNSPQSDEKNQFKKLLESNQNIQKESPIKQIDFQQLQQFGVKLSNSFENSFKQPQEQPIKNHEQKNNNYLSFKDLEDSEEEEQQEQIDQKSLQDKSVSFDLTESQSSQSQKESQFMDEFQQNPLALFQNLQIKQNIQPKIEEQKQSHFICDFSQPQNTQTLENITKSQIQQINPQMQSMNHVQCQDIPDDDSDNDIMLKSIQEMMESTRKDIEKMNETNQFIQAPQEPSPKKPFYQNNPFQNQFEDIEPQPRSLNLNNFHIQKF